MCVSDTGSWSKLTDAGQSPSPRCAACLVPVGNKLYLFGGVSNEAGWFDDVYMFDLGKIDLLDCYLQTFTIIVAAYDDVSRRIFLISFFLHKNKACIICHDLCKLYCYVDTLSLLSDKKHWSKLETQGLCPSPRDKLAGAAVGSKVYIFGGFGPQDGEEEEEEVSAVLKESENAIELHEIVPDA